VEGYEIIEELRRDRSDTANGIGGGLIVYVRDGLVVLPCDQTSDFNQYCKFCLKNGGEQFYVYLMYRPPTSGQASKDQLCELLRSAEKNSLFIGDFNLPSIDWATGTAAGGDEGLVQVLQDHFFEQLVDFPTHIKGNCLDLLLTNIPHRVSDVTDSGRLGRSDHVIVTFQLRVSGTMDAQQVERKNWRKADWQSIKNGLHQTTWPTTYDGNTAEEAWQLLRTRLNELTEQYVPTCVFKQRRSDWMTGDILRELRKKRRLWKKAKQGIDREAYVEAERKVKNLIRNAKRNMERRLANQTGRNSKPFYNYVKKRTSGKSSIGPLKNAAGVTVSDEEGMAEELNSYFSSVFTREDTSSVPNITPLPTKSKLRKSWITAEKVRKKIKDLKPHSAAGPDGISPRLLQECIAELSPVLAMIYRKSMDQGIVPAEWKTANVVPIFKKGSKSASGNYRPVSLTSVCCKILESIIKDDLMSHLLRNKLISGSQHGFMKNRSCTTNLLEFLDKLTQTIDSGKCADVVYLDFAKAFDKVPTERLLKKLHAHGVEGQVAGWIRAWLTQRSQRVVLNGKKSSWCEVLSGLPQGSVLGPILFVLFINDLDRAVTAGQILNKFADDTKIAQVLETQEDAVALQASLDRLCQWADTWGMSFNVLKCHVMHLGAQNPRYSYTMNGTRLAITEMERDIGVMVSSSLKPSQQCKKAAQTASTVLGQITRSFHYRDRHVFKKLYLQYVRPHLEFAVTAWSPWARADIECLENVQKRAVRAISGLKGQSYEEKLKELNIASLQDRRREMDMVQTYKMVNNIDMDNSETMFVRADTRRPTRERSGKDNLLTRRYQHEYRRNFFSVRVIEEWNALPDRVKEAGTTVQFRRLYRRHAEGTVAPAT